MVENGLATAQSTSCLATIRTCLSTISTKEPRQTRESHTIDDETTKETKNNYRTEEKLRTVTVTKQDY